MYSMSGEDLVSACEFFAHDDLRDSQKEMLLDSINILGEKGFLDCFSTDRDW